MSEIQTICAIATGAGQSGIGIVRVSGPKAISCVGMLYRGPGSVDGFETHHAHLGSVVDPKAGAVVDEVLFLVMKGPHSYTGEDIVEIQGHGNPYVLSRIVDLVMQQGARLAEPGEFTKRAFLNGRLDLAQAEAVMDLIAVTNEAQHRMALGRLRGSLSKKVVVFRNSLLSILGELEAAIDFSDQEVPLASQEQLESRLIAVLGELQSLLGGYDSGKRIREGATVAIVGRPNVGKSSLMNALLKEDRAIVSAIPGTTRDLLVEGLDIQGLSVNIVDTAGLRTSGDFLEEEGVRRARRALKDSDLILCLLDSHVSLTPDDLVVLKECEPYPTVIVLTKTDLTTQLNFEDISRDWCRVEPVALVSVEDGTGLDGLKDRLKNYFLGDVTEETPQVALLRHKLALENAEQRVVAALEAVRGWQSAEFPASDVKQALDALGSITGETTVDDVLNEVFSQFCIGK